MQFSNLYYDYEEYENICLDINYKRSIAGSKPILIEIMPMEYPDEISYELICKRNK